jgi:hypothetical protein
VVKELSRRSYPLLVKLHVLFMRGIYKALGNYSRYLEVATLQLRPSKAHMVGSVGPLSRVRKRKRSIRRSYRSRLFFSKKGRIWLTR